ncbi:RNA-directed DNA polymerase, eukaryota, Reverse transcriptase zinc-binding domain protein [Artemisia annua]|uniref:RNA-directed DNA polymerase, eukaryota, Reverse transcriptase zinc-binding domain protein n=1 Tax=Artemisia annua TaxID=35608 RepID=A0A2U1LCJ2_ARTAN|nr:RNA-directed DNA polymerase, eukaryota, Reverse transcriptase zinc-binding domain protein [Artemisia annua]
MESKVADVIDNGDWAWPKVLSDEFDGLLQFDPPHIQHDKHDIVKWKTKTGRLKEFSVTTVWNDIRESNHLIPWAVLVWYSQYIPRHSFMVWLAIHGRLKTHDKMFVWEHATDLKCVFCKQVPDSHNHLFFECPFSRKIWADIKVFEAAMIWEFHVKHLPDNVGTILLYFRPFNAKYRCSVTWLVYGCWISVKLSFFEFGAFDQANCPTWCEPSSDDVWTVMFWFWPQSLRYFWFVGCLWSLIGSWYKSSDKEVYGLCFFNDMRFWFGSISLKVSLWMYKSHLVKADGVLLIIWASTYYFQFGLEVQLVYNGNLVIFFSNGGNGLLEFISMGNSSQPKYSSGLMVLLGWVMDYMIKPSASLKIYVLYSFEDLKTKFILNKSF